MIQVEKDKKKNTIYNRNCNDYQNVMNENKMNKSKQNRPTLNKTQSMNNAALVKYYVFKQN